MPFAGVAVVDAPVVPLPEAARGVQTHAGGRIIQIVNQCRAKLRVAGYIFEVLIEKLRGSPAHARIRGLKRG